MENQDFTPAPDNHLVKSILTMLFCCLPFGIVALINSTKVEGLWNSGQREQAQKVANDANKWGNIALICGIAFYVIYLIYIIVMAVVAGGLGGLF